MKIVFWSNVHGQTGTTSNALAISIILALRNNNRILLTHNHYHHSTLEHTLFGERYNHFNMVEFEDSGIDAVSRMIKYEDVDGSCIENYSTTLIKNRLDFLAGTRQANEDLYYKDLGDVIDLILDRAKKIYDFLVIDLSAGKSQLTNKILESSDLVVVNLNQNLYVLNDFFENHYEELNDVIFIISKFDPDSKYNVKRIKQKYKLKHPIFEVPYSINFANSMNKGKVIDFIAKNLKAEKNDENYIYIKQIDLIAAEIMKSMVAR